MKRRDFLRIGAMGAPLGLPLLANLGCSSFIKRVATLENGTDPGTNESRSPAAAGAPARMRVEASSREARSHLESYARAVVAMKAQPDTVNGIANGLSWKNQAQVHKDKCPHGTWRFFPWHREYLFRFEEIIRKMSGDPEFSLPYWDWSANPNLPIAFKSGALAIQDSRNPAILDGSRTADLSAGLKKIAGLETCQSAVVSKDFETFMGSPDSSGQIEYGPHNGVHVVLGSYGGPMGDFLSPLDPIFWLHHCNVDRLWSKWQEIHPEWSSPDTLFVNKLDAWLPLRLDGFYDTDGKPMPSARVAKDVINTRSCGYIYADSGAPRGPASVRASAAAVSTQLKVRAFTRDPIRTRVGATSAATGVAEVIFPDVRNTIGQYLDQYVAFLHHRASRLTAANGDEVQLENLIFRLKVLNLPKVQPVDRKGALLKLSFITPPVGGQPRDRVFLTFYNFFLGQAEGGEHAAHMAGSTVPPFNLNYNKLLEELAAKGISEYPAETKLEFQFFRPDGSRIPLAPAMIGDIQYKVVALERIPGNER